MINTRWTLRLLIIALGGLGLLSASEAPHVTFNRDVLPLLQRHCQTCHRPGEAAPMSLLTYETTRPWAKAMKAAVLSHKMPPWYADPHYGHFRNDRRMPEADVQRLVAWVDAGAPEGSPEDKHAPLEWTDGWNIRPDIVFELPKPYAVPATGRFHGWISSFPHTSRRTPG